MNPDWTALSLLLRGPTMDPRMAYEISMRLPHLGLRMTEHGRRALKIATRLDASGVAVVFPGLPQHPDHERYRRLAHPEFGYMAVSLGYFDTLMSCPGISTSSEMPEDERDRAGIRPGLVGVSMGYTGTVEQRWEQLERGLERVGVPLSSSTR